MPCRTDLAGCHRTCAHRALITAYRAERTRQEDTLESHANGYPGDARLLIDRGVVQRPVTFKTWLTANRRRSDDEG